jgi:hypothetical protein
MQTLRFAAPLLLAAVAAAQGVIVPSAAATQRPAGNTWWHANPWYGNATVANSQSHSQLIYDVTDVGVPAGVWNSFDFRRPGLNQANSYLGNTNYAGTTNATIVLSISNQLLGAVTNTFATNVGANPITVLNGMVNLPAGPAQAIWPHPWINVPFTSPFPFVRPATGTLVLDILQTGNTSTAPWYLEAQLPNNGGRTENGGPPSTCRNSNNTYASGLSYFTNLLPGGPWMVNYNGLPPNTNGFGWLGAQGVGGMWGGMTLPISLAPFGAPGCNVNAGIDIVVPLSTTATGTSRFPAGTGNLMVPNNPALAGQAFYEHSMWLDAAANAFGAVVGWGSKWNIGTGLGAPAAVVSATSTSAMNPTGTLNQQTGVSVRFNP